jgi:dUTP pyrophosphatase
MNPSRTALFSISPSADFDIRPKAPTRAHDDDAGFDLTAPTAGSLQPGERKLVKTGVRIAVPAGMAGLVLSRSGLALKHGVVIVNSPGLIDPGYRGDVGLLLANWGFEPFEWAAGDRLAQLVLVTVATQIVEVSDLPHSDSRGVGGFGSTG